MIDRLGLNPEEMFVTTVFLTKRDVLVSSSSEDVGFPFLRTKEAFL